MRRENPLRADGVPREVSVGRVDLWRSTSNRDVLLNGSIDPRFVQPLENEIGDYLFGRRQQWAYRAISDLTQNYQSF
jgi:hypothetical protein